MGALGAGPEVVVTLRIELEIDDMSEPRMFYFGPWDRAGHFFFDENGRSVSDYPRYPVPWQAVDGVLQPKCDPKDPYRIREEVEGEALLHHKDGWTALCFWDRSVDKRGACNSNYFAEGTFTFEQMVEMAKRRFSERWGRMAFDVRLA